MRIYLSDLGHNLLSKYYMLGLFFVTQDALTFLDSVIRRALSQQAANTGMKPLDDVIDYLRNRLLHSPFDQSAAEKVQRDTAYDVEKWAGHRYCEPFACYRSTASTLHAKVESERRKLIETKLEILATILQGLVNSHAPCLRVTCDALSSRFRNQPRADFYIQRQYSAL